MDERTRQVLNSVSELPNFDGVDMADVNAIGFDGDNALHVVVGWGDLEAAKTLIDDGIDINKPGDLGYTPLHVARMAGNLQMVKLLIGKGANLFALCEGYPPFTSARLAGKDEICDFLAPLMDEAVLRDPRIKLISRISELRRELAELEAKLERS